MENKSRKRINFLQNVSIALLTLSAVVLFAQMQFYNLGNDLRETLALLDPAPDGSSAAVVQGFTLSAPLRIAVSDSYGRYGNISITTASEEFLPLDSLLKASLGSAKPFTPCTKPTFLSALTSTSVYCDFLSPLPLSVIAAFSGISSEEELTVRSLIISGAGEADVTLYLWDGKNGYYQAGSSAARNDLTEAVSRYELGTADFALDLAAENSACAQLHPCSLFLRELPQLPQLSAAVPPQITDRLLIALDFNPNTKYRSTESNGAELIVENDRSLRVHPNGSVHYFSGSSSSLHIDAEDHIPTPEEAAFHSAAFLISTMSPLIGDASIYLQEISRSENVTFLRFGYHVNGTPLRFSNGSYAAEVTLTDTTVTSLDMNIRQYTASADTTPLLPLQQALAIAARDTNTELSVGYVDKGGSSANAAWLSN